MQEIIARVATAAGVDDDVARKAVSVVLGLIKSEGDGQKVSELFSKLPGADDLAAEDTGSGGLFGSLGGATMAAYTKLTDAGLNTTQMRDAGKAVFSYVGEQAGDDLVKDVVNSIPALAKFV